VAKAVGDAVNRRHNGEHTRRAGDDRNGAWATEYPWAGAESWRMVAEAAKRARGAPIPAAGRIYWWRPGFRASRRGAIVRIDVHSCGPWFEPTRALAFVRWSMPWPC